VGTDKGKYKIDKVERYYANTTENTTSHKRFSILLCLVIALILGGINGVVVVKGRIEPYLHNQFSRIRFSCDNDRFKVFL